MPLMNKKKTRPSLEISIPKGTAEAFVGGEVIVVRINHRLHRLAIVFNQFHAVVPFAFDVLDLIFLVYVLDSSDV